MSKPQISSSTLALAVDFPVEIRGYKKQAVDEFIEELSLRLTSIETDLDTQAEKCETAERELCAARKALQSYAGKEAALVDAILAAEQRRASLDAEGAEKRVAATRDAERIVAEARSQAVSIQDAARHEAQTILSAARNESEELQKAAILAAEKEEERLITLRAEFSQTLNKMREELQSLLALLPEPALAVAPVSPQGGAQEEAQPLAA